MGYQPTATPDMGGVSIETRSESFYLYLGATKTHGHGYDGHTPVTITRDLMVEIEYGHIDTVVAACAQAKRLHEQGDEYEWVNADGEPVDVIHRPRKMRPEWLPLDSEERMALAKAFQGRLDALDLMVLHVIATDTPDVEDVLGLSQSATDVGLAAELAEKLTESLRLAENHYLDQLREVNVVGAPPEPVLA